MRSAPVLDFEGVLFMDAVHIHYRTGFEDGVELHGHAETTKHHVGITVLGAKSLVGHFKTRGAVDGAVDPGYLRDKERFRIVPMTHSTILYQRTCHCSFLPRCGCGL